MKLNHKTQIVILLLNTTFEAKKGENFQIKIKVRTMFSILFNKVMDFCKIYNTKINFIISFGFEIKKTNFTFSKCIISRSSRVQIRPTHVHNDKEWKKFGVKVKKLFCSKKMISSKKNNRALFLRET